MIGAWRSRCLGHRAALLDFVDRREIGPSTDAALDHLDRCRACEGELTDIALAITALRRIHHEARDVEPAHDAWLRLRASITRRPAALWRWRMTLGGLMTSATLVGALAGPMAIDNARDAAPIRETLIETVAPGAPAADPSELRIETEFIVATRQAAARDASSTRTSGSTRVEPTQPATSRIYADGIRVVGEEVAITDFDERPPGVS